VESARSARRQDLDVIVELLRAATVELGPHRGGSIWSRREAWPEPVDPAIAAVVHGESDHTRAVVGTIDDTVVGYGLLALENLHDGSILAVVSDLYVLPGARGVGVGEAMMDRLVAEAREAGAIGIDALALPGDRETKNFFERFGLTARALVVHRSLVPAEDGS